MERKRDADERRDADKERGEEGLSIGVLIMLFSSSLGSEEELAEEEGDDMTRMENGRGGNERRLVFRSPLRYQMIVGVLKG